MKSVMIRLREYEENASEAEKEVVNLMLREPELVMQSSIQELAHKAFTSPSTVVRLCNKLEFHGYKEFRKALIYELALRQESSIQRSSKITKEDSLEDLVEKVTYRNIASLENSRKLIDYQVLSEAVGALTVCEGVFLFGIGSSLLVAKDAWLKFMRLGKRCYSYDDWHGQLTYAKTMTAKDVAIMISYSGMTEELLRCAKEVQKAGGKIIAITRFEASPLAKMADYCLNVSSMEQMFRSGAMASRMSQLNMIDILYSAYLNQQFEKNVEQITKTYMEKE